MIAFTKTCIGMVICLCLSAIADAQDNPNVVRKSNENVRIAIDDLIGKWYSSDTISTFIEFVADGDHSVKMEGYKPGVGQYSFLRTNDSIHANGSAPNWPPFDCTITLIDDATIVLKFYQYFSDTTRNVVFRREE